MNTLIPSVPRDSHAPPPRRWGRLRILAAAFLLAAAGVVATVTPAHADAYVTITDSADPVPVGTPYTYTVAYTGLRNVTDASITLTGATATVTAVTSSNPDLDCVATTGTTVACDGQTGGINNGTVTVTVLPTAAGTVTANAFFNDCCVIGTDSENTTVTAANADLGVSVAALPHLGILVPYLSYTVTAHNNGPGDVTAATLTATLPAGKTATNLSTGCTSIPGTVTCTYGAITNGASATSTFRLPIGILSLGHVTVAATRTASTPTDNNAANDSATATCTVVSIVLATCP
ncbi:hypothetical protein [Embleya sp. MST-111070]|uniref:hypothetical protein n=1 Tax=Embleya sp. MST-111070 TaxID=3398231 RepID=UPI003F73AA63